MLTKIYFFCLKNILYVSKNIDSEIKIIDFGLSITIVTDDEEMKINDIIGSVYYMAPETFDSKYSKKSDM